VVKIKKISVILIYFMIALISYAETVIIAINSAPPYRIIEGKKISGIYVEIIKEVFINSEIKIIFKEMPLKRGLESMRNGEVDLILGPNKTEERSEYIYFIEKYPFPKEDKIFYYNEEKNKIVKYEDLYKKRIGVLRGAVYFKRFDEDKILNKEEVNDYLQGVQKVKGKRNDVIIIPELQGDYLLRESKIDLKKSPFKVEGNFSYIGVSKKSKKIKKIIEQIEEGMKKILDNKKYEEILMKYGKIESNREP
jgi:polar amino acid transport system substrate-binding protein